MILKKLTQDLMVKDVNKTVDLYREISGNESAVKSLEEGLEEILTLP